MTKKISRRWLWGAVVLAAGAAVACFVLYRVFHKAPLVGVLIGDARAERWLRDGLALSRGLQAEGFRVQLSFQQTGSEQAAILRELLKQKPRAILIAAEDPAPLVEGLQRAAEQDCRIIAYDRLLTQTPHVDAYVTFDSRKIGQSMAEYVAKQLFFAIPDRPLRIAIVGGSRSDNNAVLLHEGILTGLAPLRRADRIELANDSYRQEDALIRDWAPEPAAEKMRKLLKRLPNPDAVICSSDILVKGVLPVLKSAGLHPVVTGQDASPFACRAIAEGYQSMTVFKDTRLLARLAVDVTRGLLAGKKPATSAKTDNGTFMVPSYYATPRVVTAGNMKKVLFDSGYYQDTMTPRALPDGFVYLARTGKTPIVFDLRYAQPSAEGGDKALPGYLAQRPSLTREAASALERAARTLSPEKVFLLVTDAYRPSRAALVLQTKVGAVKSRCLGSWDHTNGSSVDVTLVTEKGEQLDLGPMKTDAPATPEQQKRRDLLKNAMQGAGFLATSGEWWHFRLRNEPFPVAHFDFDVK